MGNMNLARLKRYGLHTLLLGTTLYLTSPHHIAIAEQSVSPVAGAENATPPKSSSPSPAINVKPSDKPNALQPLTEETAGLLVRSLQAFFGAEQVETKSQFQLEGTYGAMLVKISGQNHNILKDSNLFRTEFAFQDPSDPSKSLKKFMLISNGKTLWTYRPDTKQYSIQPYQSLGSSYSTKTIGASSLRAPSMMTLGFLSASYLGLREKFIPILSDKMDTPSIVKKLMENAEIKEALLFQGYRSLENQEDAAVYQLNIKMGSKGANDFISDPYMELWIHPKTQKVARIQFKMGVSYGKQQNIQVQIQENVLEQQSLLSVPTDTFYFQPPKGARLVKTLPFTPF